MDLSNVTFNKNHKAEAAAKDAASGMRLLLVGFVINLLGLAVAIALTRDFVSAGLATPLPWMLMLIGFVATAYGAYLAATALDWAGFITIGIVLSMLIPYLKFIAIIVLIAFSIDLIRKAGYKVSLFGPLRKVDA